MLKRIAVCLLTAAVVVLPVRFRSFAEPATAQGLESVTHSSPNTPKRGRPLLYKKIEVPPALLAEKGFAGDVRIGDLDGDGRVDFVVFRSTDAGMKPCFLGSFTLDGRVMWSAGEGGGQPARPGPVAVHDLDGDGRAEVICFFIDRSAKAEVSSMANVMIQIREGRTGRVRRAAAPAEMRQCSGSGANWVHQRLLVANLRGTARPRDFVVKLGATLLAFSDELKVLWTYDIRWNEYGRCTAYIPAVGDIDGDGRDEVNGGYYFLDEDGKPLWEKPLGHNMDSVAIVPWDSGRMRAICSGFGHVVDAGGEVILSLGKDVVPHGQEVRVADFIKDRPGPEMILRYNGHSPDVMLVANDGRVVKRFRLNRSPNETGMEAVLWQGSDNPSLLYNGGVLWRGDGKRFADLPDLPKPAGDAKMGWYHCIPANVCGDEREDVVLYNPWDRYIWIYTPAPLGPEAFAGYRPGPRQYNPRLMD